LEIHFYILHIFNIVFVAQGGPN